MADKAKDYLCVISNGMSGSYYRGPDKQKAIASVVKIYKRDFRDYFKCTKGTPVIVNVVDVTGHDNVWWNDSGFHVGKEKLDRPIEKVTATF